MWTVKFSKSFTNRYIVLVVFSDNFEVRIVSLIRIAKLRMCVKFAKKLKHFCCSHTQLGSKVGIWAANN